MNRTGEKGVSESLLNPGLNGLILCLIYKCMLLKKKKKRLRSVLCEVSAEPAY